MTRTRTDLATDLGHAAILLAVLALLAMRDCAAQPAHAQQPAPVSDRYVLTLGLAAEEGASLSDGHTAMLHTLHARAVAAGISDAREALRYCSALRGLPQSAWGVFLLSLEPAALFKLVPDIAALVDAWLDGKPLRNPCGETPIHFGGRNAAAQRPNARALQCGTARSTFFAAPKRRTRGGRR